MPTGAHQGATSTHGGIVVSKATHTLFEGNLAARMGDLLICPKHGPKPIIATSATVVTEGAAQARLGDKAACGAIIIPTITKVDIQG